MAKEVVIQTWCDIEYADTMERIDGSTITWHLYGTRMEIDLCPGHQESITVAMMDHIVQGYGREWEDPSAPVKKPKRRRSRAERVTDDGGEGDGETKPDPTKDSRGNPYVLHSAEINDEGQFVCVAEPCARGRVPFEKITGLRMHQRRAHDIQLTEEEKVKA